VVRAHSTWIGKACASQFHHNHVLVYHQAGTPAADPPVSLPGRVGPGAQGDAEKAAAALEETLRSSKQLRSALEHSTRVGDLLLKSEEAEVARVQEYAEDLLDHEYR